MLILYVLAVAIFVRCSLVGRAIAILEARKATAAERRHAAVVSASTRDAFARSPKGDTRKLLLFKAILDSKDERIRVLEERRDAERRIAAASPVKVKVEATVDQSHIQGGGARRSSNPASQSTDGGSKSGKGPAAASAPAASNDDGSESDDMEL